MINITIDGAKLAVEEGSTIVQAAQRIGIRIPTLCYHPDLSLPGACRVCVVDVKDMGFHMPACSTVKSPPNSMWGPSAMSMCMWPAAALA